MHADTSRHLAHVFDRFLPAFADGVGCSERFGQLDSGGVPSENDDLFCAQSLRRNDAAQTYCAVTDNRCFLPATDLRHYGRVMARSHHI